MFFERSHKENTADNALRCRVLVGGYLALSGRIDAEVVHSPFSLTESEAPVTAQPCSIHSAAAVARRRRCRMVRLVVGWFGNLGVCVVYPELL